VYNISIRANFIVCVFASSQSSPSEFKLADFGFLLFSCSVPDTSVEENVAKSETEVEQAPTETVEAPTSTPATAAPETTTETATPAPEAPPIAAAAAENKDEVPVPAAKDAPIEEAVEAVPKTEAKEDELKETGMGELTSPRLFLSHGLLTPAL
jgi:hypothetical protein